MTAKDFVTWAQSYYGAYPEGQKADIWHYLKNLSPEYLAALKTTLLKRYSAKWGHAPDVAIFEENRREARDSMQYLVAIEAPDDRASAEDLERLKTAFGRLKKGVDPRHEREGARV